MRRLTVAMCIIMLSVSLFHAQEVNARHSLSSCGHTDYFQDIPCSEVDRAIRESAKEFSIDEGRFRRVALCESGFNPFNSRSYWGLFQHSKTYWPGRVRNFNTNNNPDVLGNPESPFDNARIAAWMIRNGGWSPWPNC